VSRPALGTDGRQEGQRGGGHLRGVLGVANTLFPIFIGKPSSTTAWWEVPYLTPVVGYEVRDLLENVAVFVPLGVLLPLVARATSLPRVVVLGFLISLTIELLQWVSAVTVAGGHAPDVNDLLSNTLGAPLGYGVFRLALLLPAVRRLARAATWPVAPDDAASTPGAAGEPVGSRTG
jgi:VanZ family protein